MHSSSGLRTLRTKTVMGVRRLITLYIGTFRVFSPIRAKAVVRSTHRIRVMDKHRFRVMDKHRSRVMEKHVIRVMEKHRNRVMDRG